MKYLRILLLNVQRVFEERGRSFVWFLLSIISPLLMILFWRGAHLSSSGISFSAISSYYLLLVVAGSFLMSHSEEDIATRDIQQGRLSSYILKPFSYFLLKWFEELPYRLLQGSFGILTLFLFFVLFQIHISFKVSSLIEILFEIIIVIGALLLAHIYKMMLGFIAFWITDAYGIFELSEMLLFIFAGYIAPLSLYPSGLAITAYVLPFAYMIYFPVSTVQGIFSLPQLVLILLGQIIWISISVLLYKILWYSGVKTFTGVGQ